VSNARKLGGEQFDAVLKEHLIDRSQPVSDPLKRNNLPTFYTPRKRASRKIRLKSVF
jgi:hypothetical protein